MVITIGCAPEGRITRTGLRNYAAFFSAAFFFAAQRFFIAIDSAFRPASVRLPFLTGTGVLPGATLGVAATGAVAFFRFAQDAFIASDIFALNSASSGGAITSASFFETFGEAASAFAALIAA